MFLVKYLVETCHFVGVAAQPKQRQPSHEDNFLAVGVGRLHWECVRSLSCLQAGLLTNNLVIQRSPQMPLVARCCRLILIRLFISLSNSRCFGALGDRCALFGVSDSGMLCDM